MEKKETDCPINDINEDRIENALKQYNEVGLKFLYILYIYILR